MFFTCCRTPLMVILPPLEEETVEVCTILMSEDRSKTGKDYVRQAVTWEASREVPTCTILTFFIIPPQLQRHGIAKLPRFTGGSPNSRDLRNARAAAAGGIRMYLARQATQAQDIDRNKMSDAHAFVGES